MSEGKTFPIVYVFPIQKGLPQKRPEPNSSRDPESRVHDKSTCGSRRLSRTEGRIRNVKKSQLFALWTNGPLLWLLLGFRVEWSRIFVCPTLRARSLRGNWVLKPLLGTDQRFDFRCKFSSSEWVNEWQNSSTKAISYLTRNLRVAKNDSIQIPTFQYPSAPDVWNPEIQSKTSSTWSVWMVYFMDTCWKWGYATNARKMLKSGTFLRFSIFQCIHNSRKTIHYFKRAT